jgi:hypothetical protein
MDDDDPLDHLQHELRHPIQRLTLPILHTVTRWLDQTTVRLQRKTLWPDGPHEWPDDEGEADDGQGTPRGPR